LILRVAAERNETRAVETKGMYRLFGIAETGRQRLSRRGTRSCWLTDEKGDVSADIKDTVRKKQTEDLRRPANARTGIPAMKSQSSVV
jgi:hypothetical protein